MDIENLTLKELRELANTMKNMGFLGGTDLATIKPTSLYDAYKGKYVLVRSRNEGINAGYVEQADETGVVLNEARRIWYHRPADNTAWYEGVSNSGLRHDSKISAPVLQKAIIEDYSITLCTAVAEKSIRDFKNHEQE